jgi:signal transduction histidine kinase
MLKLGSATRHRWATYAPALALLLAGVLIAIDFDTWIELDVAALFGLPLLVAALAGRRLLLWGLAGALLVTTFVAYAQQIPPGSFSLREPFFLNRVLDAIAMLLTGGLLHALTLAMEKIERQNAQISAQNERKTRLLASVSHDISTPLTSMNVIAQLIRGSADRQSGGADVARLAATLEANARALAELFSDLLDLSSIDSGTVPLRETEFRVDELLREECRVLEPLAQEKGLRLAVDAPAELRVRTDRIKLARVVRNLLSNALKFTDAGSITASCRAGGGAVEIRVADSGVGIAPADRERIFLEFTQLNGASAAERAGWGLGLAICRRLVALMGGTLEVESEPGRGSTFIVRLPAGSSAR